MCLLCKLFLSVYDLLHCLHSYLSLSVSSTILLFCFWQTLWKKCLWNFSLSLPKSLPHYWHTELSSKLFRTLSISTLPRKCNIVVFPSSCLFGQKLHHKFYKETFGGLVHECSCVLGDESCFWKTFDILGSYAYLCSCSFQHQYNQYDQVIESTRV